MHEIQGTTPVSQYPPMGYTDVVGEIATAVEGSRQSQSACLADGQAGIALFLAYFEKYAQVPEFRDLALARMNAAIDQITPASKFGLWSGLCGIAWCAEHIGALLDPGGEDVNAEIDQIACDRLEENQPEPGNYDLISGLVGVGVFALERAINNRGEQLLHRVVDGLWSCSERRGRFATWFTPPRRLPVLQARMYPDGYYNLGLAHGIPGVIAFLGSVLDRGFVPDKVDPMLRGSVDWLMQQRRAFGPVDVLDHTLQVRPNARQRLAWCYGEAGVATALLIAARALRDAALERHALTSARAAARMDAGATGVVDASLCHGSGGLAHIFRRLYRATNEPEFERAANAWIDRTLAFREPNTGLAGFQFYDATPEGKLAWQVRPGVLMGVSGVGLALLGALDPSLSAWDRALLVNIDQSQTPC